MNDLLLHDFVQYKNVYVFCVVPEIRVHIYTSTENSSTGVKYFSSHKYCSLKNPLSAPRLQLSAQVVDSFYFGIS